MSTRSFRSSFQFVASSFAVTVALLSLVSCGKGNAKSTQALMQAGLAPATCAQIEGQLQGTFDVYGGDSRDWKSETIFTRTSAYNYRLSGDSPFAVNRGVNQVSLVNTGSTCSIQWKSNNSIVETDRNASMTNDGVIVFYSSQDSSVAYQLERIR